jgi:hypothetical protein
MGLPASGQITLNQVNVELGNSGTAQIGMNDAAVRGLFGIASGEIEMSDGYGKSNEVTLTSAGTVNGQAQRQQITVSSFISSGGTLVIPSNIWVWSDSTSAAALTIDVPCTIKVSGKVIGKGGAGVSSGSAAAGLAAGPAIKINSGVSGVTIQNLSGAYIAGGGGSGGSGAGRGGGGAGGGNGGVGYDYTATTAGGVLNAVGARGATHTAGTFGLPACGYGGGAGGGGAGTYQNFYLYGQGGGAGGRILPGAAGAGGGGNAYSGSAGGSANNAGVSNGSSYGGGGGGGWGAVGGASTSFAGGAAGKAVDDSGVSYTLTNSGTIYGAT